MARPPFSTPLRGLRHPATLSVVLVTERLTPTSVVYAPVEKAPGVFALEAIEDVSRARPDAVRTILPFKKLLMKPRFTMMEGTDGSPPRESRDNDLGPVVFFGGHACDVHALRILDLLYLSDYVDPYYRRNREKLTVVGYGCMPDDKCFCHSLGTSNADDGLDFFLNPLDGRFLVTVASARGDDIVQANATLFQPATRQDTRDYLQRLRKRTEAFTDLRLLQRDRRGPGRGLGLPRALLGRLPLPGLRHRGRRPQLPGRPGDRVRNRYYHKREAFVREFGMPSCVGAEDGARACQRSWARAPSLSRRNRA